MLTFFSGWYAAVNIGDLARWYAIPQSVMYFWDVMEGSWNVRRKYCKTMKSKNKHEYAEFDVIRVIIVSFATTARHAKAAAL